MKHQLGGLSAPLLLLSMAVIESPAQPVTYTFESSQFVASQTSPFLNESPDFGPSTFRANFTSSPNTSAFFVSTFSPNPAFAGQNLFDGTFPPASASTLTISLNASIQDVQFDFALFAPGRLQFQSSAGTVSAFTPANPQYGGLTFHGLTGFTQFTLQGFDSNNLRLDLAIDNLSMTLVPEPGAWCLLLLALGWRRIRPREIALETSWT